MVSIVCCKKDCGRGAVAFPILTVPVQGLLLSAHRPWEIPCDLPMCQRHFSDLQPSDLLTEDVVLSLNRKAMEEAAGRPDYSRPSIERGSLTSSMYDIVRKATEAVEYARKNLKNDLNLNLLS